MHVSYPCPSAVFLDCASVDTKHGSSHTLGKRKVPNFCLLLSAASSERRALLSHQDQLKTNGACELQSRASASPGGRRWDCQGFRNWVVKLAETPGNGAEPGLEKGVPDLVCWGGIHSSLRAKDDVECPERRCRGLQELL